MNSRGIRTLVSLILVTSFPMVGLLAADKPAAVLHSSGTTTVNGLGTSATTALFNGDDIQTISGLVTISSPGSTVLVPSSSKLVFQGNVVNVSSGTASINTTTGMSAQTDSYRISPATSGPAKFDVKRSGNLVQVHATKGTLTVNSLTGSVTVPEGKTATLDATKGTTTAGLAKSATPVGMSSSSLSPVFSLDKTLSEDPSDLPYCGHAVCHIGVHHNSGERPCKCAQL